MTLRYSFSRVWTIAVAVICMALFIMSAVGYIFAQRMHYEFKHEMAFRVELLKLTTNVVYEISETSAEFGKLLIYQGQSTDVSNCILHLDHLREQLNNPVFAKTEQAEFRQILNKSELRLRTMLYAYKATNFSDPARDKAQESLEMIVNVIRDARQLALGRCQEIQTEIDSQTRKLVKLTERARLYLYIALAACLISVLSMVFVIGRELRKRLQYIISATDHIRGGDAAYRIEMPFEDEISKVASRFNAMAEEIEKKETQLNDSNRILSDALDDAHHANTMKDEFLANIGHEIRTPMNAIMGFTNLVLEDKIADDHKRYLTVVQDASNNLMEIIDNILDFSRIGSGRLDIEKQDCPISDVTQYIESLMVPLAQKKNLLFEVHQCRELPAVIQTDPLRIRQCLINLINNAIKFTHQGHVYLNLALENRNGSQWMRFDVEDTGIGVPPDKLEIIFEPFRQADGSTSRQYGGIGLGLSITRKLAELLGGIVSVKSTVNVGSVFTLLLPLSSVGKPAVQTPASGQTSDVDKTAAARNLDIASL